MGGGMEELLRSQAPKSKAPRLLPGRLVRALVRDGPAGYPSISLRANGPCDRLRAFSLALPPALEVDPAGNQCADDGYDQGHDAEHVVGVGSGSAGVALGSGGAGVTLGSV